MIKAAIFDMDGLLIDSERIIMQGCIAAAAQIGITYTEAQYVQLVGRVWSDASRLMAEQLNGEVAMQQVIQGLNDFLAARNHVFPLKPGVEALLQHYRNQGVVCSVASSSPIPHITHRLGHTGVLDYFAHVTSGQEVTRGKPHPDIYLLALQKLGLPAEDCIAFEDSEPGAEAAVAAGLRVVMVPDIKAPSAAIRQQVFHVADSLHHWLAQHADILDCAASPALSASRDCA